MEWTMRRRLWKYYHDMYRLLSGKGHEKRAFLKSLKADVRDYIAENAVTDISLIQQQFGRPEEIADAYFSELSGAKLARQMRWLKAFRVVSVVLIAGMLLYFVAFVHSIRQHSDHVIKVYVEMEEPQE